MLTEIEKEIFECSLCIKELLQSSKDPPTTSTTSTTSDSSGVKLPKLDIATFSGNVLEWHTFWEQFRVSVHDRPISDAEKLVYLRQALKNGTTKNIIEGLSRSGEHYGRRQNKLPVSVSYSAGKTLQNGSCRRHSVFTVRA